MCIWWASTQFLSSRFIHNILINRRSYCWRHVSRVPAACICNRECMTSGVGRLIFIDLTCHFQPSSEFVSWDSNPEKSVQLFLAERHLFRWFFGSGETFELAPPTKSMLQEQIPGTAHGRCRSDRKAAWEEEVLFKAPRRPRRILISCVYPLATNHKSMCPQCGSAMA